MGNASFNSPFFRHDRSMVIHLSKLYFSILSNCKNLSSFRFIQWVGIHIFIQLVHADFGGHCPPAQMWYELTVLKYLRVKSLTSNRLNYKYKMKKTLQAAYAR